MQAKSFIETLTPPSSEPRPSRPLTLRNYIPKSGFLKQFVRPAPTLVGETEISVQRDVHEAIQEFLRQQDEPLNVVPKRPNWDLKRELERKLEPLARKTESALAQLLQAKLSQEKTNLTAQADGDDDTENKVEGERLLKVIEMQAKLDADDSEYHPKAKRNDMNSLIRSHHFRFGSANSSFETTNGSTFTAQHSESPTLIRGEKGSHVYLGGDRTELKASSRLDYQKPSSPDTSQSPDYKSEHRKHHFTLGLHSAESIAPTPEPRELSPSKMCRPPQKTAIVLGTDAAPGVSITKGDYRPYTSGTEVVQSMKGKFKGCIRLGTEHSSYETTASAIGRQRGEKREKCEQAQRTYVRWSDGKASDRRSLSQEHYSPYKPPHVESTGDRSAFVLSTHFSLGSECSDSPQKTSCAPPASPPREQLPHLKKTSVELGSDQRDKESVYATHFQPFAKGDRAVVSPWTGCSVAFGERHVPLRSDYGANFLRHSLGDNCIMNSLDLQRHNFQLGHRKDHSFDTAAGDIGRDTSSTFLPNTGFTSFSKQAHFSLGTANGSFDTTAKSDYTFKGAGDKVKVSIPPGVHMSSQCDYRTVHQASFKWVQPVPSS